MLMRRKIHRDLKILASLNALPTQFKQGIHRSQLQRYKNMCPADLYGHELSRLRETEFEWIRQAGDFPRLKSNFKAVLKVFVFFRSVLVHISGFNKALHSQRDFFVELAQRFKEFIPIRSFAKLIGIDESTLLQWIRQVRVRCSDSIINSCRTIHPNQLLVSEINKMKKLLGDDEFCFWSLKSLYYFSLRNKIVSMGESTWYKYAGLLNVKRMKPKTVKTKETGIRATKPNELWHADVMYFFTPDRMKYYIYTVVNNFSRFPLSVEVSDKLSGKFRVQTFRNALKRAIEIDPSATEILLMTDGGSENFNVNVQDFLKSPDTIPIHHIKALSDGWPSNSMAEALNQVIKIYYLNNMDIRTFKRLKESIEFTTDDFAMKRPHGQLKGLTPYEVYAGKNPDSVSFVQQLQNARIRRVIANQNHKCSGNCHYK